ncbi:MAG: tyrosine-type recombinase/integrase [Janthinobacterium lividum]
MTKRGRAGGQHHAVAPLSADIGKALAPVSADLLQVRLATYQDAARGAYARATEKAFQSDSAVFTAWCSGRGTIALPALPDTVAAFIEAMAEQRKPATIRRYVSTISHMHKAAEVQNPCTDHVVRFALRRMAKALSVRQQQAKGINRRLLDRMLDAANSAPRDLRNRALLAVAYDTLARRSELVALQLEDLKVDQDGHGSILIRQSKTDQLGEGSTRYLAPDTVQLAREWVACAGLTDGALFRATRWNGAVGGALTPGDVGRIFKAMATAAKLPAQAIDEISGHSTRVGAAQDMEAADIGMAGIMQAGGWKTPTMVGRYTSQQATRKSGAAKLAERQGRVESY